MVVNRSGLKPRARFVLRRLLLVSLCLFMGSTHAATQWWETRHGDFHIVSKLSRAETAQIARDIQIYQIALAAFFPKADIQPHVPVTLLLLDKKLWNQYLSEHRGKVGMAFTSDDHYHVVVNGDVWLQASSIVYHELTHIFMHKTSGGRAVPVWLDEGYADLLSTVVKAKDHVKVGVYPKWRLYSLHQEPWLPLQTLLRVSHASPEYKSEKLAGAFYAQSWLMAHFYVFGNPQRKAQIRKYITLAGEGEPPQSAFAKAFPGDAGEFEQELQRYSRQKRLAYIQLPVSDQGGKSIENAVTALAPVAAAEELATWMLRYQPLNDANMAFLQQQAKDGGPTSTASLQLAVAYLMKDQPELAKPYLDAGCVMPKTVTRTALLCGDAHTLLTDAKTEQAEAEEGMLLARQYFMAALQIEPHNVEALTRAAYTYRSLGGDADSLLAALRKSMELDPRNPSLAIGMATILQHTDPLLTRDYLERAIVNVADPDRSQYLLKWLDLVEQQIAAGKNP